MHEQVLEECGSSVETQERIRRSEDLLTCLRYSLPPRAYTQMQLLMLFAISSLM
jgi:hypothetical protein